MTRTITFESLPEVGTFEPLPGYAFRPCFFNLPVAMLDSADEVVMATALYACDEGHRVVLVAHRNTLHCGPREEDFNVQMIRYTWNRIGLVFRQNLQLDGRPQLVRAGSELHVDVNRVPLSIIGGEPL